MQMSGHQTVPTGADYNSSDAEFMKRMVPHHEMAISMAAAAYTQSKNTAVRDFALQVFSAQSNEVAFMKAWLSARGLKPYSSM